MQPAKSLEYPLYCDNVITLMSVSDSHHHRADYAGLQVLATLLFWSEDEGNKQAVRGPGHQWRRVMKVRVMQRKGRFASTLPLPPFTLPRENTVRAWYAAPAGSSTYWEKQRRRVGVDGV